MSNDHSRQYYSYQKLAKQYTKVIKKEQPLGPYHLFGWSFGGALAMEVARQLELQGDVVERIIMVDSYFSFAKVIGTLGLKSKALRESINFRYDLSENPFSTNAEITLFQATELVEVDADNLPEAAYMAADLAYNNAADLVGSAMGTYGLTSMAFALILTFISRKVIINRKLVHMFSLLCGGLGFILMLWTKDAMMLNVCFALIGISWASILSMPYAMLSSTIDPNKMGIYMGLFNMFIVIPQIIAAVGGINFMYKTFFGEAIINTMLLAGVSLIIACFANLLITDPKVIKYQE